MILDEQTVKEQLQNIIGQRDKAAQTFEQCVGAIALLSEQLKMIGLQQEINTQESQDVKDSITTDNEIGE